MYTCKPKFAYFYLSVRKIADLYQNLFRDLKRFRVQHFILNKLLYIYRILYIFREYISWIKYILRAYLWFRKFLRRFQFRFVEHIIVCPNNRGPRRGLRSARVGFLNLNFKSSSQMIVFFIYIYIYLGYIYFFVFDIGLSVFFFFCCNFSYRNTHKKITLALFDQWGVQNYYLTIKKYANVL